MTSDFSPEVAK